MNRIVPVIFATFAFCGCASILSKSNYIMHVNSSEPGAVVKVFKADNEIATVRTPAELELSSGDGYFKPATYRFEFSKDGFEPAVVNLSATVDPMYMLNIMFGGIVGMLIVDPATGAMWQISENVYGHMRADASNVPVNAIDVGKLLDEGLISTEDATRLREYLHKKENNNTRKVR